MRPGYGVFTHTERSGRIMVSAGLFLVGAVVAFASLIAFLSVVPEPDAARPEATGAPLPWAPSDGVWVEVRVVEALALLVTAFLLPRFRIGWWMAVVQAAIMLVPAGIVLFFSVFLFLRGVPTGGAVFIAALYVAASAYVLWACLTYRLLPLLDVPTGATRT